MNKPIQPVVALHPSQREAVERLVAHCKKLDGTILKVIDITDEGNTVQFQANNMACRAAWALRQTAIAMRGKHFIWLEPDSIPTKPDWNTALSEAYWQSGAKFLLSSDSNPPFDLVGGIGVYPPETAWLVPKDFEKHGWDMFLITNLSHLVARTPLIQHSYGVYSGGKVERVHRFPQDSWILRTDAVMFHADKHGDLTRCDLSQPIPSKPIFAHSGDIGDIIAALPFIRKMGGGRLAITHREGGQRESMRGARYEAIAPLLCAQQYIDGVEYSENPIGVTHDISTFRNTPSEGRNLAQWQAGHFGMCNLDQSPWLKAAPDQRASGRVALARSGRYHNSAFPWRRLLDKHGRRNCFFVGMPEEHYDFRGKYGPVDYIPTANLLELAGLLAGARLLIANQSCPFWIGAGLGIPLIQETYWIEQNSIVERDNARYFTRLADTRMILA